MQVASDIMVKDVLTCSDTDSLLDGHKLMQQHHVRHIPVISEDDGRYLGMLTHKEVLKQAFQITDAHGTHRLDRYESRIKVGDIMACDVAPIAPDLPIDEAGEFFLTTKQGCLPVCENNEIIGILTSIDFVKLSVKLLKEM